jgi:hypothetical protein
MHSRRHTLFYYPVIHPIADCHETATLGIEAASIYCTSSDIPHLLSLLPLYCCHYLPLMLARSKLQIPNPLPRPRRQLPIPNRNRNTSTNQGALDMCLPSKLALTLINIFVPHNPSS